MLLENLMCCNNKKQCCVLLLKHLLANLFVFLATSMNFVYFVSCQEDVHSSVQTNWRNAPETRRMEKKVVADEKFDERKKIEIL